MKKEFSIPNKTPGGIQIVQIHICDISIDELITCTDESYIKGLCETGCVNYGKKWSCPPFSPSISRLISNKKYDKAILICGYINLKDMAYIKNPYQKVKAANMILKSKCESYARRIEEITKGYALLSGSCNLCKPCYKKKGLPCNKPDVMRYSLESTGINVGLLSEKYCGHQLLWYKKGFEPDYTSVITMVLVDEIDNTDIEAIINV